MEDRSFLTNNHPTDGISDTFREYIAELVKEVVFNGESFDAQKKWLRKNSEAEGVSYEAVESNLNDLFEAIKELEGNESKFIERSVRLLAKECYLSEDLLNKLIDNAATIRRQKEEDDKKEDDAYRKCTTIEACDDYLKAYPQGRYVQEVRNKKTQLEQEEAQNKKELIAREREAERIAKEEAERKTKEKADSLFKKGQTFFREFNFKEAVPYLLESALLGDSRAQATLSNCYGNGKGVERSDKEAFRWAMASAQQNNPWGQVFVGIAYLYGSKSVKPDNEQAFYWFKKSADQNNSMGLYYLGQCYYNGIVVAKNTKVAYECFRKSADLGDFEAKSIVNGDPWRLSLYSKEKLEETRQAIQHENNK